MDEFTSPSPLTPAQAEEWRAVLLVARARMVRQLATLDANLRRCDDVTEATQPLIPLQRA